MLPLAEAVVRDGTPFLFWLYPVVFAVGVIGIVIPVLPGLLLATATVVVWAYNVGGPLAWTTAAVCVLLYLVGVILQVLIPGRKMKAEGVGTATLALGVVAGIVGFFVVPVIGLPLFFVGAVYLVEYARFRDWGRAWAATKSALRGVLRSMGIELLTATAIAAVWLVGIVAH